MPFWDLFNSIWTYYLIYLSPKKENWPLREVNLPSLNTAMVSALKPCPKQWGLIGEAPDRNRSLLTNLPGPLYGSLGSKRKPRCLNSTLCKLWMTTETREDCVEKCLWSRRDFDKNPCYSWGVTEDANVGDKPVECLLYDCGYLANVISDYMSRQYSVKKNIITELITKEKWNLK